MKRGMITGMIIVLVILGGLAFFLSENETLSEKNSGSEEISNGITEETKEITMTATKWAFSPSEIKVNLNDKVILHVKSIDVSHGFSLPAFNVNQELEPGKEITVEFTADKKGNFTFVCNVYCGQGHLNMKGNLIVE